MKPIKSLLALTTSILILASLPNLASARTSFHIGIGYGYPHYGLLGRHRWIDRGWHRSYFGCAPRRHHWRGHWRYPHVGFWIDDWHLRVITKEKVIIEPKYDDETQKVFKHLRAKKGELLKKLKLTDKKIRKESISELAGFSFDEKVKKALEDILLSDPDSELRIEAAKSFSKVKNDKAIPTLEKVRVEDSEEEVRKEADKAIKTIRG